MMPKIPGMVMTTLSHISQTEGHYDYNNGGVWVDGTATAIPFKGAVMPLSYQDMKYDSGGTYTSGDRKLYTYEAFENGGKMTHEGLDYTIQQSKDYSQFGGGLHIYIMKRGVTA